MDFKSAIGGNTIEIVQDGVTGLSFNHMSMTNDPEASLTADGTMTLEFEGDPKSS